MHLPPRSIGYLAFREKKETVLSERVRQHLKRRAYWALLGTGITMASAVATIRFLVPVLPEAGTAPPAHVRSMTQCSFSLQWWADPCRALCSPLCPVLSSSAL